MVRGVLLTLLAVLTGCVSHEYRDVPRHDGVTPPYTLFVGDAVSIITNDEQVHEFRITGISSSSIRGDDVEISYDDIQAVQVRNSGATEKESNFLYILMAIELVLVVAFTAAFG
ncbi:MAG: hypothetical protein H6984_14720 [Pseudomonadales bacterium]|nr:hypothetical protein [Halioglobus sp.]MCP5123703.1 hypothetical protein [Pseudomonadales bacterium]MCP5192024.1 hypothetical protein [Pseudomonadales bacterium]